MLSPDRLIPDILLRYPEHLREQIQADLYLVLDRHRHYLISQIQLLFSQYPGCPALGELRSKLDELFLSPDDGTLQTLRSHQTETGND